MSHFYTIHSGFLSLTWLFSKKDPVYDPLRKIQSNENVHNLLLCNCLFSETVKKLHLFDHKYSNIVTI